MRYACGYFALLLTTLNFTSVPIPNFNESFLGATAFNLTCSNITLGPSELTSAFYKSATTATSGGWLHCSANLTAYAYSGHVHADIAIGPSTLELTSHAPWSATQCWYSNFSANTCVVNATVTNLYADPPSRLVDALLRQMRVSLNEFLPTYVCDVVLPELVHNISEFYPDILPARETVDKPVYPMHASELVMAGLRVFDAAINVMMNREGIAFPGSYPGSERAFFFFELPGQFLHAARTLVATDANVSIEDWLRSIIDNVVDRTLPEPFPVYGLPGTVSNFSFDTYGRRDEYGDVLSNWNTELRVDATMASCDANTCELYLHPGVELRQPRLQNMDKAVIYAVSSLMASALPVINAKISALLASVATKQGRDPQSANATVTLTIGNKAVLRESPKVWPLLAIAVFAAAGGTWAVRRNLRLHAAEAVMNTATGTPVSAARLVAEDVFMLVAATACLMLFAASNTMTGASVILGQTLNTYSFSMWNTVTDLWRAGLVPLSVCVFIFSGVYPYVKLLCLVYFTVVLQRPLSKRLALIDVLGKFSFIDTFALMVMVSGLEIRHVARVFIHAGFALFLFATIASIALGNYATTLYRRGTSHRVVGSVEGAEAAANSSGNGDGAGYVQVAAVDTEPAPTLGPAGDANAASEPSWQAKLRTVARPTLPFLLVLLCSLPAWLCGCLQYTVGGVARLFAPTKKTLTLWQLGYLNSWGEVKTYTSEDDDLRNKAVATSLLITALTTMLLAPCLFTLMPRRCAFLASWCATDVFVLACVAGLLQLHQFVTFVLGDGMEDLYTAHATLLWPMLLLTLAAVMVWRFTIHDVVGSLWPPK